MESLRWQYIDVINERLFADSLEIIPSKFKNDESSWRRILHPYILEDLRASLLASLQKELQEECDRVKRIRIQFSDRSVARLSDNSEVDLEFQVVSDATNQQQQAVKPEEICGSLNILIRTGSRFENGDSLHRTAHSFIYIKSFNDKKALFDCSIYCMEISHFFSLLQKDKACDILLIQVPLVPALLAINSLVSFIPPFFFKDVLTAEYDRENSMRIMYRNSLRSESVETLNASQRAAVEQIMNSTDSPAARNPALQLIHGPPGTGKTSTLISIIHTLFLQRRCTHITAPTNKAIRVLIEKYLERFLSDKGSNLSDLVLVGTIKRLGIDADHYLSNVTLTHRVQALKAAVTDLPKAVSEVRGYLREFGLCRMYEGMVGDKQNFHDFSIFCRSRLTSSFDRIIRHLDVYTTQHPRLNSLQNAQKYMSDLVARFSDRAANLESYFSDEVLIAWQRDMDAEDCRGASYYRDLFSAIDSDISQCYKFLGSLRLPSKDNEIGKLILANALLVFSTVASGASYTLEEKSEEYDVCIVDEATQLVEAYTAQVFSTNLQCLILAGDHRQLPATVNSQFAKGRKYDRSLFERLISNNYPSMLLNTQYRMHPDICLWPNHTFYANKIINGANVSDDAAHRREWCDHFAPVSIINAAHGVEKEGPSGSSKCNELEEKLVRALINNFKKLSTLPTTVGIISPYKAQVANLKDLALSSSASFSIVVSTVDGCQGQEFDIVIFSAVRANNNRVVGFLDDVRRLNVAITRPKFTLVVVCNIATVTANPTWRKFVEYIESGGRVVTESPLIRRVYQKYATQQNNLEELLSPSGFVFEKCSWKISFTGEFKNSLRKSLKRDKVILLLQTIGQGEWSDSENLNKTSTKFQTIIHISKVDNASRLIWSIDVQRTCDTCKQCIKVWDICLVQDHSLEKNLSKVERGYSIYSEEYLARCLQRKTTIFCGKTTMVPEEWEKDRNFTWTKPAVSEMATARDLEVESLNTSSATDDTVAFMKFYELSSKVARILIKSSEANLDLPFVMSEEEEEIVKFHGSAFILGRSGTGKTTVMLHRMLMEQHYIKEASSEVPARQIFVTASPVLCEAIKRSHESMRNSIACNKESTNQSNSREVVDLYTNERGPSLESLSFDDISDSKFPLIITYKVFMDIMYNSFRKTSTFYSFGIRKPDDSNEIHFDNFRSFYYLHFPSDVTSKVDVKILYTEIRSVIKGSLEALASANGRLSRNQYVALSASRSSELSSPIRELIYTAYERYEQMKRDRNEFDMDDFVFFLYSGMEKFGFCSRPCTSVFVDEVQDLSAAQIALFKFCCPNLAGFVMAGDTAQTISEGVGFRFEALKDVFFHQFLKGLPPTEAKNLTPNLWELTQNFRTHNGVLFIARKIVDMIVHFFPNSIDRMKPESSAVFGPKPIFLESQPGGDNLISQLFNDSGTQNMVDFGAEQVILVRDENAKKLTKAKSGQNALVITALESKGMEFDDVMIVNFFSSSPFKDEWRVIENFSSSGSGVETSTSRRRFDPMKHGMLNTELKMLYVLVTRAKKRLIFADDDLSARKPMLDLLLSEGLIEMKQLDEDIRALFSGRSTSDEWIQKGDTFMLKRQFSNAKFCYGKGGDTLKEQHASAAHFEQEGDRLTATDLKSSKNNYLQSSELFRGLNKLSDVVRCFEKANEYEQAASIYESMTRWYDAGVCYEKVLKLGKASNLYWKCYAIPHALRCAYACHEYTTAIDELRKVPQSLQPADYCSLITECARKGALYFHRKKQLHEMMNCISSFPSTDSKRDFLKQYSYFDQVLDIELADECFENAAKIYLEMFEFKKASHYFHKAGCHRQASDNAIVAVRQSCLDSDRLRLKTQYSVEDIEEVRTMLQPSLKQSYDSSIDITLLELSLIESVASMDTDAAVQLMRRAVNSTSKFSRLQLLAIFRAIDLLATEMAIRWLEFWEAISYLQQQFNIIIPSLERSISSQALSLLDRGNIDECAAFFEGKLITKGLVSSVLLCAIPCTQVMFGIRDDNEQRKSISMKVSAFATVAATYFRTELKASCSALSKYLIGQLECISKLNLPAYIKMLERDVNQSIPMTTQDRLRLLVPLLQVLRVEEDKSNYNLAVTKIANLCFAEYSFLEDAEKVSEARIAGGLVGECLKHFLTRFNSTELKADMIVKCLLISELVGNTEEVATRLEKVCTRELRQRRKENELDFRKLLVEAFIWEQSEHTPPNFELGPFLFSLDQGFTALDNDCWKGTIASCVYSAPLPDTAKAKDGCISPQLFLKLIEKYTVLASAIRKNYTNVILPRSLFEDVLCRCNKAYCNDILSCDSSKASSDRVKYSSQLALRIFPLLESILVETLPPSYFAWFQANSITPLKEEDLKLQSAIFVLRIIVLLKTIIVNFTDPKLYDRYNKLSEKFEILSTILDVFPISFRKKLKTKTMKSTDLQFFRSFSATLRDPLVVFNAQSVSPPTSFIRKFKLLPQWIVIDSKASSISSVDEKPGAAASSMILANEEEEEVVPELQAVEESVVEEGRKEAEQTTLPPAKKVFPTPRMASILMQRLQTARVRISNLTETERFQRTTERQLVEVGTNRCEPNSLFYLNEVCPRLLVFAKLDLKVETFKSRADDEDVEIVDSLIVLQNTLQRAVENLNIRSPLPDTEEMRAALERAEKIFEELDQFMSSELIALRIRAADEKEEKGRQKLEKSAAENKPSTGGKKNNNNNPAITEKKKPGSSATSKNSRKKK